MLKNQNGIPASCRACSPCSCNSGNDTNGDVGNMSYLEASRALKGAPLAYTYAPDQSFRLLYSAPEALAHGTLFEELYIPMEVYGNG